MKSKFRRIQGLVDFEENWKKDSSWNQEKLWSHDGYEGVVEELTDVRLYDILHVFPHPSKSPYKSKPGEFVYHKRYDECYVNDVNFYDIIRAYRLGYLDMTYTVVYTLVDDPQESPQEFEDIFGKHPAEGINFLRAKLEFINNGKKVEIKGICVNIRQSNEGRKFCYRMEHGKVPKIPKEEIYRGVLPTEMVGSGGAVTDMVKSVSEEKNEVKKKQINHLNKEEWEDCCKRVALFFLDDENKNASDKDVIEYLRKYYRVGKNTLALNTRLGKFVDECRKRKATGVFTVPGLIDGNGVNGHQEQQRVASKNSSAKEDK